MAARPAVAGRLSVLALLGALGILLLPDMGRFELGSVGIDARFVLVNALAFIVTVVDFLIAPAPDDFEVTRTHPSSVPLGHEVELTWAVRRREAKSDGSWKLMIADDLMPSLHAVVRRFNITVPSVGEAKATTTLRPARRGQFDLNHLTIRTAGPIGLLYKQQRVEVVSALRVVPVFASARHAELTLRQARTQEAGLRSVKGRGGGTEFESLRDMTIDDETRRIDWAATARLGRPIVRTFRAERNQTVMVALDAGRSMAGRVSQVPRLELGMDGAMLLAELATGLGDRIGFVAFDRTVHSVVNASPRRSQRTRITDTVYDLEPVLAETNYQALASYIQARHTRRSLLVIITDLGESSAEEFVLPNIPLLARKHLVVIAAVKDPDVEQWSQREVRSSEDAHLRGAALAALEIRHRNAVKLRGAGAIVIDATPDDLPKALSDTYLSAKAMSQL